MRLGCRRERTKLALEILAFEAEAAKKNGIIDVVAKGDATWRHARRGSSRNHKGNGLGTTSAASSGLASEVVDEAAEFALTHPPAPISKREVPKTNRFMVAAGGPRSVSLGCERVLCTLIDGFLLPLQVWSRH